MEVTPTNITHVAERPAQVLSKPKPLDERAQRPLQPSTGSDKQLPSGLLHQPSQHLPHRSSHHYRTEQLNPCRKLTGASHDPATPHACLHVRATGAAQLSSRAPATANRVPRRLLAAVSIRPYPSSVVPPPFQCPVEPYPGYRCADPAHAATVRWVASALTTGKAAMCHRVAALLSRPIPPPPRARHPRPCIDHAAAALLRTLPPSCREPLIARGDAGAPQSGVHEEKCDDTLETPRHVVFSGADPLTRRRMMRAAAELAGMSSVVVDAHNLPSGREGADVIRTAFQLANRLAAFPPHSPQPPYFAPHPAGVSTTAAAATTATLPRAEAPSSLPSSLDCTVLSAAHVERPRVTVDVLGAERLLSQSASGPMVYPGNTLMGETARAARGVVVLIEVRDVDELWGNSASEWPVQVKMVAKDGSRAS